MRQVVINREVYVTAVYFKNSSSLRAFPKRMEFNGREFIFEDNGLVHLIQKGHRSLHIFDMTDGISNYRLRFDTFKKLWTLIDVSACQRALV